MEPFLGEIRPFGFNFAPRGWALCDGQILPIAQNPSLYSLLGTTYGGDGRTTFALPDLRGRTPVGFDSALRLGTRDGQEQVTLTLGDLPSHDHSVNASADAGSASTVTGNALANGGTSLTYGTASTLVATNPAAVGAAGGGQAHDNMQPFLTLNYCIAVRGLFPSRN